MKVVSLLLGSLIGSAQATSYVTYTYRGEERSLTYNIQILAEVSEAHHEEPVQMRAYIRGSFDNKIFEALFCVDQDDFQEALNDRDFGEIHNLLKIPDESAYGWAAGLSGSIHVGVPEGQDESVPYPNLVFQLRQKGPPTQLLSPTKIDPTTGRNRAKGVPNQFTNCESSLKVR